MTFYFSRKGMKKFREEVKTLEDNLAKLKLRTQDVTETGGDMWHDNPALYTLMSEMRMANGRLGEYYGVLGNSMVVDYPTNPENVCLGSAVVIVEKGEKKRYQIAGYGESDPDNFVIAYNTPLAKALIGKKPGGIVNLESLIPYYSTQKNKNIRTLKIIEVGPYEGE